MTRRQPCTLVERTIDQGAHQGRIIVDGTRAELKALLPPAKVEYVEKQPTLEEVFFAIVGDDGSGRDDVGHLDTEDEDGR